MTKILYFFAIVLKSFHQLTPPETSAISVNKRSSCSGCCMQVAMHLPRKLLVFSNYLLFIFCMLFSLPFRFFSPFLFRLQLSVGSVQNYVQFSDNFHVHDFYDDVQELIKCLKALLGRRRKK